MEKSPRDICRRCGIDLEGRELGRGLCIACARREIAAIGRYFRNGIIIGLILALLLYGLLGVMQKGYLNLPERARTDNIRAVINMTTQQRLCWAAMAFVIPFGYFYNYKVKNSHINESVRAEGMVRTGGGAMGIGMNLSEGVGMFIFLLGVVSAPVVGPVLAVYRIVRAVQLRRYVRDEGI